MEQDSESQSADLVFGNDITVKCQSYYFVSNKNSRLTSIDIMKYNSEEYRLAQTKTKINFFLSSLGIKPYYINDIISQTLMYRHQMLNSSQRKQKTRLNLYQLAKCVAFHYLSNHSTFQVENTKKLITELKLRPREYYRFKLMANNIENCPRVKAEEETKIMFKVEDDSRSKTSEKPKIDLIQECLGVWKKIKPLLTQSRSSATIIDFKFTDKKIELGQDTFYSDISQISDSDMQAHFRTILNVESIKDYCSNQLNTNASVKCMSGALVKLVAQQHYKFKIKLDVLERSICYSGCSISKHASRIKSMIQASSLKVE